MAQEKANKFTLRGIVTGFVNMAKPDTKFNPAGEYKVQLIVQKNDPRVAKILAEIQKQMVPPLKAFQDAQAKLPPVKRHRGELHESLPYIDLEDGTLAFKFKSIASGVNAKGESWERVIPHFGADGRIDPKQVPAYGEGSDIAISCTVGGFANKVAGNGASLRIEQVKLYSVERFGGGGAASDFDDDGDGYSAGGSDDDFDEDIPAGHPAGQSYGDDDEQF